MPFESLREFMERLDQLGELKKIDGGRLEPGNGGAERAYVGRRRAGAVVPEYYKHRQERTIAWNGTPHAGALGGFD